MASTIRKPPTSPTQQIQRKPLSQEMSPPAGSGRANLSNTAPNATRTASPGIALNRRGSNRASPGPMSALGAARRPAHKANSSLQGVRSGDGAFGDDSRAEQAHLIEELKQQAQKAELASEQYQKELEILQMRLNEAVDERNNLEEQSSRKDLALEAVQLESNELMRQKHDMELVHEKEKERMLDDREVHTMKEAELHGIIERLNETIKQKEFRSFADKDRPGVARTGSFRSRASQDIDSQLERSPSRNNSTLLLQKDKMIESLRLELAEVQIKLAEMEHMGDGRLQEVEKQLLETRMSNARLMEDNESFQLLLSEKTLKGDFMSDSRPDAGGGLGTLADELESASDDGEGRQTEAYKKMEAEAKAARESNKALTLYIDKIIGRLLQHDGLEHIILERDEPVEPRAARTDKALPAPPEEDQPTSFLQRARSVVSGKAGRPPPKTRPLSYMPTSASNAPPTAHENPNTAPSIPLNKGHRRSRSDQQNQQNEGATAAMIVSQMRRGSPLRASSGGVVSPGISPSMSPSISSGRSPFFVPGPPSGSRVTSGSGPPTGQRSMANSLRSEHSGEVNSHEPSSPPRDRQGPNALPAAVMKQNQLRPLQLGRSNTVVEEEEAARKKANRASWMPAWFNRTNGAEGEFVGR